MRSSSSRDCHQSTHSSRVSPSRRNVRSTGADQLIPIASRVAATPSSRVGGTAKGVYMQGRKTGGAASSARLADAQYSRNNPGYASKKRRGMSLGKKIALGAVAAVVLAVVGCGTAFALYVNSINDKLGGNKSVNELQAIQDVLAPKKSFTEPFYMLLVGSDARAGDDEMGARSDTNIVARIDPKKNMVTLVSIPRDTQIYLDGYGTNKFNAAYNYGGISSTIREANELLNVQISHYAEMDFDQLVSLVDAVGGVDVEVAELIDDTDADGSTDNPRAEHIVIRAGQQHLNGKQALVFARSRAYVDGDFTRTANQRKLIGSLVSKVLALPVTQLPGVIQSAADCVTTDLSVSDIAELAQQFRDEGDLTLYSGMVPSTTGYEKGISYVYTDEDTLKEMMKAVENGEDPSNFTASPEASSKNSSGQSGSTSKGQNAHGTKNSGAPSKKK